MTADFDTIEWLPQAILNVSIDYFRTKRGLLFYKGQDELDLYEGADLKLPNGRPYALRHYRRYPAGTVTIYLPFEIQDVEQISASIRAILDFWTIPSSAIRWERADGLPEQS